MNISTLLRRIAPALVGAALLGFGAGGVAMAATTGPAATSSTHSATAVSQAQKPSKQYCKKHPTDPMCK